MVGQDREKGVDSLIVMMTTIGSKKITYEELIQQELDPILSGIPLDLIFNAIGPLTPFNMACVNKTFNDYFYLKNIALYFNKVFTMNHGPRLYLLKGDGYEFYEVFRKRLYDIAYGMDGAYGIHVDDSDEEGYDSSPEYDEENIITNNAFGHLRSTNINKLELDPGSKYFYKGRYIHTHGKTIQLKRTSKAAASYQKRLKHLFTFVINVIVRKNDKVFEFIFNDKNNEHFMKFIRDGILPVYRQDQQPKFRQSRMKLINLIFMSGTNRMVSIILDMFTTPLTTTNSLLSFESKSTIVHQNLRTYAMTYATRLEFDLALFKRIMVLLITQILRECYVNIERITPEFMPVIEVWQDVPTMTLYQVAQRIIQIDSLHNSVLYWNKNYLIYSSITGNQGRYLIEWHKCKDGNNNEDNYTDRFDVYTVGDQYDTVVVNKIMFSQYERKQIIERFMLNEKVIKPYLDSITKCITSMFPETKCGILPNIEEVVKIIKDL